MHVHMLLDRVLVLEARVQELSKSESSRPDAQHPDVHAACVHNVCATAHAFPDYPVLCDVRGIGSNRTLHDLGPASFARLKPGALDGNALAPTTEPNSASIVDILFDDAHVAINAFFDDVNSNDLSKPENVGTVRCHDLAEENTRFDESKNVSVASSSSHLKRLSGPTTKFLPCVATQIAELTGGKRRPECWPHRRFRPCLRTLPIDFGSPFLSSVVPLPVEVTWLPDLFTGFARLFELTLWSIVSKRSGHNRGPRELLALSRLSPACVLMLNHTVQWIAVAMYGFVIAWAVWTSSLFLSVARWEVLSPPMSLCCSRFSARWTNITMAMWT